MPQMVERVELTPDCRYAIIVCTALAGHESAVYVWNLRTQQCVSRLAGAASPIRMLDIAADGEHWLVASQDGMARMWGLPNSERGAAFRVSHSEIATAALTRDAAMLAVGCIDGSVDIWGMDWQIDTERPADWEERVQPLLESHISGKARAPHTVRPSRLRLAGSIPRNRRAVQLRKYKPDADELRSYLSLAGFGWLSINEINTMVATCLWQLAAKKRIFNWR